jgi:hypothetical protein
MNHFDGLDKMVAENDIAYKDWLYANPVNRVMEAWCQAQNELRRATGSEADMWAGVARRAEAAWHKAKVTAVAKKLRAAESEINQAAGSAVAKIKEAQHETDSLAFEARKVASQLNRAQNALNGVTAAVEDYQQHSASFITTKRHDAILALVNGAGSTMPVIVKGVEKFGVSTATAYRDVAQLIDLGLLTRKDGRIMATNAKGAGA